MPIRNEIKRKMYLEMSVHIKTVYKYFCIICCSFSLVYHVYVFVCPPNYVYLFREKMFVCLLIYYYLSVCYLSKQSYNIYHLFLFICLLLVTSVSRHIYLSNNGQKHNSEKQQQMHSSLWFSQ